jgi:hypothetical protein
VSSDGDLNSLARYWHEVEHWTVGELRAALNGLPNAMVLRVEVSSAPSTCSPDTWGDDQFVVTAAAVDDGEYLSRDEFVIRVDFPTDYYMRAVEVE